jgi:hypothetical protein
MRERSDHELEQLFALDGDAGPARPVDDRRASAIIAGALGGAGFPSSASGGGNTGGAAATAGKAAIGVKLAIITGGLATIVAVAWFALHRDAPPATTAASTPAVAPAPAPAPTPAPAPAPALAITESPTLTPTPTPTPEIDPAPADDNAPVAVKHHARARTHPATSAEQLDDLLAEANAQRAAHEWKAADALYARVVAASPKGLAGQTALVASATLHLEHLGDPTGAERRFRSALAHPSSLAEDARWGVAECERARGDTAAERRALDDFLAHHASSPIAPRARARLAELAP